MVHCMIRVSLVLPFLIGDLVISVPFEEDDKDPSIWFLDHNYHEAMFSMFKRINGSFCFSLRVNMMSVKKIPWGILTFLYMF